MKLRAIGARAGATVAENFAFKKDEVERLAEMEHRRWLASIILAGYSYGPRDEEKKTHPLLIPWESLSEEEKEWDRQPVRKIPIYLGLIGEGVCQVAEGRAG